MEYNMVNTDISSFSKICKFPVQLLCRFLSWDMKMEIWVKKFGRIRNEFSRESSLWTKSINESIIGRMSGKPSCANLLLLVLSEQLLLMVEVRPLLLLLLLLLLLRLEAASRRRRKRRHRRRTVAQRRQMRRARHRGRRRTYNERNKQSQNKLINKNSW